MRLERDALQAEVFPTIRDHCRENGADFRVVDLRWGIPPAASELHTAPEICISEVHAALRTEVEPRLLCLLGSRYGWRPLPPHITEAQFRATQTEMSSRSAQLARRYFVWDENATPPHYALRAATQADAWSSDEGELRAAIDRITDESDPWLWKHSKSLTEREIREGLDAGVRALAVIRSFGGGRDELAGLEKEYFERDERFRRQQSKLIEDLERVLPRDNIAHFDVPADALLETGQIRENYLKSLTQRVQALLLREVDQAFAEHKRPSARAPLSQPYAAAADRMATDFIVRERELESIRSGMQKGGALLVDGVAGSGKSTLLGKLWSDAQVEFTTALCRFSHLAPSSQARAYLGEIAAEIRISAGLTADVPSSESQAIKAFREGLSEAAKFGPAMLVLDGLDEVAGLPEALTRWLPETLPEGVRLVLGMRSGNGADLITSQVRNLQRLTLNDLSEADAARLLDAWLTQIGRRLQTKQRKAVLERFKEDRTPLWARLAFDRVRRWRSLDPPQSMPSTSAGLLQETVLRQWLDPNTHVVAFTKRALALIDSARSGLTENELLDVVGAAEDFWQESDLERIWSLPANPKHGNQKQVPDAIWGRLKSDVAQHLMSDQASEALLRFRHAAIGEAVRQALDAAGSRFDASATLSKHFAAQPLRTPLGLPNTRKLIEWPHHALRNGEYEAVAKMLCDNEDWKDAHIDAFGSLRQYYADLDLGLASLARISSDNAIPSAVRLVHRKWVVDLTAMNAAPEELRLMVLAGQDARALFIAENAADPERSVLGQLAIVQASLDQSGAIAEDALGRMHRMAERLSDPWRRAEALGQLVFVYARIGKAERALSAISGLAKSLEGNLGQAAGKGALLAGLVGQLCEQRNMPLAEAVSQIIPSDFSMWKSPADQADLARAWMIAGDNERALQLAENHKQGMFDYSVVWEGILRGAAATGSEAVHAVLPNLDPNRLEPRLRYRIAALLAPWPESLEVVLKPALQLAADIAPKLAAGRREAAGRATDQLRPLDTSILQNPPEIDPGVLERSRLENQSEQQHLPELCYFAFLLGRPFAHDLATRIDGDAPAYAYAERAALAFAEGRQDDARADFTEAVLRAGSSANPVGETLDEMRLIWRVALRFPQFDPGRVIGAIRNDEPRLDETRLLALLAYLQTDDASRASERFAERLANEVKVAPVSKLFIAAKALAGNKLEAQLAKPLLGALESKRKRRVASGIPRALVSEILAGLSQISPAAALQAAIAGAYEDPLFCVPVLAEHLTQRATQDVASKTFLDAIDWIVANPHSVDGCAGTTLRSILSGLLRLEETERAISLARRSLSGPSGKSRLFDVLVAFGPRRNRQEIKAIFEGISASRLVWWLDGQIQSEKPLRDVVLSQDELRNLRDQFPVKAICELGLAALALSVGAATDILQAAIHKAAATPDGPYEGADGAMRSLALKDLTTKFSDAGCIAEARQCLGLMRKSGGDGQNRVDWCIAASSACQALARSGEIDETLAIVHRLDPGDSHERSAISSILHAASVALLESGDFERAEKIIEDIPDRKQRRAAASHFAYHHAKAGDFAAALSAIDNEELHERELTLVRVLNIFAANGRIRSPQFYLEALAPLSRSV
jgi:hypothetical protein